MEHNDVGITETMRKQLRVFQLNLKHQLGFEPSLQDTLAYVFKQYERGNK